jgi:predicted 2-oxoglutarate/Fe(II)-dependent dioxygenase YbiX
MLIKQKVLFSKEECSTIINYQKINHQNWKNNDRDYKSSTIVLNYETSWVFERLKNFFEEVSGCEMFNIKNEIHFHKYQTNDWFGVHNDTRDNRLYSVGVLLNEDFIGGDFKLYNPDEILLNKMCGNSYVFDVRVSHEVTPILSGIRYSLIWFIQNMNIKTITKKII